ncbi:MAG: 30S ribosome-binding factor RbfA [Oscillospiraceae bacterium]|jgi:phosphoesterase RecJ-like protein|nr:30S ribosome-binding factor RbfA [Oscillospiraceae bacterium]
MAYARADRIGEEVRRELDRIIREELRDARASGTYSLTRVEVTRDLRYARVRFSVLEEEKRLPMLDALKNAAGFLRLKLGRALRLRYTPELIFEIDDNIAYGARVASLIKRVAPPPSIPNAGVEDAASLARKAERAAIIPHVNADGDAIGSSLALKLILERLGKRADVYLPTPLPAFYRFLPGADALLGSGDARDIAESNPKGGPFDLVIAVDASSLDRLGECAALMEHARDSLVIDHHATNDGIARVNWVDKDAAATGSLIRLLAEELEVELDPVLAECLLTALSTDTGHFSQRNTDAESLAIASECVEAGADIAELAERLHKLRTIEKTRLIARALSSLETRCGGKASVMRLRASDFQETNASEDDTEGVIDFGIAIKGTLAAALITERADGIKVSFRSRPPMDVARVARTFGGGGHELASGCTIESSFDEAVSLVTAALGESLDAIADTAR